MSGVKTDFLSTRMVLVCDGCGKGFLAMPPGRVDIDPRWRVAYTDRPWKESGICGGAILAIDINKAVRRAEQAARKGKIQDV